MEYLKIEILNQPLLDIAKLSLSSSQTLILAEFTFISDLSENIFRVYKFSKIGINFNMIFTIQGNKLKFMSSKLRFLKNVFLHV